MTDEDVKGLHLPDVGDVNILGGDGNEVLVGSSCPNTVIAFNGTGNRVCIERGNRGKGEINIGVVGNGNEIRIGYLQSEGQVTIRCGGNNGKIEIGELWVGKSLLIVNGGELAGVKSKSAACRIGSGVSVESLTILNYHTNAVVSIGDGCMFAHGVTLMNSDTHPIYSMETGEIINRPKGPLHIGDKVWLGMNSTVMKGVSVADGCIVGYNATVSKSCLEPHVALAGCPAQIVRRNIRWDKQDAAFI